MESYPSTKMIEYDRLRQAYDRAFHQLSKAMESNSGVPTAEVEYHARRDALFRFLMNGRCAHQDAVSVQKLAYRFWEQAGRPQGTADSDWFHAESLLHHAR